MDTLAYLESLRRISAGMDPSRGFHASLTYLLGILVKTPLFIRPHLVIFDPEARNLRLYVSETTPRASQIVYTPGMGITGQVFSKGQPVIVEKILGHPVFLCKFFERTSEEMSRLAFISVPVLMPSQQRGISEKKVVGVLSMDTPCAPLEELKIRCSYLEAVAGIIATQAAYAQQDVIRQHQAPAADSSSSAAPFISVSKKMRYISDQAVYACNAPGPVLITGEPGSGREYLAARIHASSTRRDLPMQRYACSDQSDDMIERALFGYRRCAFPGASQTRKGLLELARNSTLFLGHIEKLPLRVQERLNSALQEQKFTRVGGGQSIDLDIHLICSSCPELEKYVEEGRFLPDLYNRLLSISIAVPPLREHTEDILPLARLFLKRQKNAHGQYVEHLSIPAQNLLLQYTWPENIRELKYSIEQAVRACEGTFLQVNDFALRSAQASGIISCSFNDAVSQFEQELLIDALRRAQGNMLQAARELKASYRVINYKVKKYGLDPRKFAAKKQRGYAADIAILDKTDI